MMASTECEGRFDFNADVVSAQVRAVMCAMDDKPARPDRRQPRKAGGDPVFGGELLNDQLLGSTFAGCQRDQFSDPGLIRCVAKMHRHLPAAVVTFDRRIGDCVGLDTVIENACNPVGSELIAVQMGNTRGYLHASEVCSSHFVAQWLFRFL